MAMAMTTMSSFCSLSSTGSPCPAPRVQGRNPGDERFCKATPDSAARGDDFLRVSSFHGCLSPAAGRVEISRVARIQPIPSSSWRIGSTDSNASSALSRSGVLHGPRAAIAFASANAGLLPVGYSVGVGRKWDFRGTWRDGKMRSRLMNFRCRAQDGAGNEENPQGSTPGVALKEGTRGILPSGWGKVGLSLFGLGVLLGPPLDAIHSRVELQVYDNGAVDFLGLHTNIWVFPLLGVFYSVAGLLQLVLDRNFAPKGNTPRVNFTKVAASFIALIVLLDLSSEMYAASVPFNIEGYFLFFCAELNWLLFENTWWGFALATLVGIGSPAAEIPIMKLFGLWHYPRANIFLFDEGIVTWVICCYFFYTPFLSNLARWLLAVYQAGNAPEKLRR